MATLQVELEDRAGTAWWAGALATLVSQSGRAYLRFVGRVDGALGVQVRTPSSRVAARATLPAPPSHPR